MNRHIKFPILSEVGNISVIPLEHFPRLEALSHLSSRSYCTVSQLPSCCPYSGNTGSCTVFKELVLEMEKALNLNDPPTRKRIRLRLDGGFGTDRNINWALSRGYQLLVKMYSGNRARKLCQSVKNWVAAPTKTQQHNAQPATREVCWLKNGHRYWINTRQIAIRIPNTKNKNGYSYCVIVTTDLTGCMSFVLADYDLRSGVCESVFCQDNQGLAARKRRKHRFIAQQVLMLLTQIAHNLIVWIKQWSIDAIVFGQRCDDWVIPFWLPDASILW